MVKNKCYGCTERTLGCHGTCDSYELYTQEFKRIRDAKSKNSIYDSYARSHNDRVCKRNRQKGNV